MLYKVTDIEFDFEDEDGDVLPYDEQVAVAQSVLDDVWEVYDEDELADSISDKTGWCVKALDYVEISDCF
jgi:hypothetical protein